MSFTTLPAAGQKIRAATVSALFTEVRPVFAQKTADEPITSSTVLQDDDELFISVDASAVYEYKLVLRFDATAASDIKTQFTVPTGTVLRPSVVHEVALSGTTFNLFDLGDTASQQSEGAGAGSVRCLTIIGLIVTSTTAGTVRLQWAQNTSGGTATIVKANSYLVARRTA